MFKIRYTAPAFESGMRLLFLLTVTVVFACYLAAADLAAEIAKRDRAVADADAKLAKVIISELKRAKDSEKPELYKLLAKYDPNNPEAKKFLEALGVQATDNSDLLNPTKVITMAQAQAIVKGYNSGKINEAAWESFPSTFITISPQRKCDVHVNYQKGEVYLIAPHPTDKWQNTTGGEATTYKGFDGPNTFMAMTWTIVDDKKLSVDSGQLIEMGLVTSNFNGTLMVSNKEPSTERLGSIRVKVFKVSDK